MPKRSDILILPFDYRPFERDYDAIAKEILLQFVTDLDFKVFVYGSRARGTHHRFSDLDIGITGPRKFSSRIKLDLETALADSRVPYRVEVTDFFLADEKFKSEAMKVVIWWKE